MKPSSIEIDLGSATMSCTADEIARTLAALLGEMRSVLPRLRDDEREVLRRIMASESGTLTVADAFPDFARESESHKTLRRFRAAQFVRPARTGRWDPDEPIEVKPFARLMWDHIGEEAIFDGVHPAVPMATPAEEVVDLGVGGDDVVDLGVQAGERTVAPAPAVPAEEEVVDLGEVEEEPAEEKPQHANTPSPFEADNIDLSEPDDLFAFAQEELRGKG